MRQNVPNMVVTGGHCRFGGHFVMRFHKFQLLCAAQRTHKKFQSCWRIAMTTKFLSRHQVDEAEYVEQPFLSLVVSLST
jgi:hypothetical protein